MESDQVTAASTSVSRQTETSQTPSAMPSSLCGTSRDFCSVGFPLSRTNLWIYYQGNFQDELPGRKRRAKSALEYRHRNSTVTEIGPYTESGGKDVLLCVGVVCNKDETS